jgi:hypothetical protein
MLIFCIKSSYLANFENFWTSPLRLAGVRKECIGLFLSTFSDIDFFSQKNYFLIFVISFVWSMKNALKCVFVLLVLVKN